MRTLEINKRKIFYALYTGKTPVKDSYGNDTGEYILSYGNPIALKVNVSAARGDNTVKQFGELVDYDRVLVGMKVPLTESSILWFDNLDITKPHDYTVTKIGDSLNSDSVAIKKVSVNA